ncbi:MAG: DNA-directed DNA polymerase II small subunit [Thermoplasmatota archaeon]
MKSILKIFSEHGTFIQQEALEYIQTKENPKEFASFLLKNLKEYPLFLTADTIKDIEQLNSQQMNITVKTMTSQNIITKELQKKMFSEVYNKPLTIENDVKEESNEYGEDEESYEETSIQSLQRISINTVKGWKPLAKEYEKEIKIIKDVTGNSTCEGTTDDFVKLFRNRYDILRKFIRSQRREIAQAVPIGRINKHLSDVQLIGIVKNIKTTVNGHKCIELEDETGSTVLIALKNNTEVFSYANEVIVDEIIGVSGKISKNGDLIIVQNIVFPDIKLQHDKKTADVPVYAAFLSDIHMGSNTFLKDEWNSFLRWINGDLGNSRQKEVAGKVKYVVLPGDLVDGIGIYPGQEKELYIPNIYQQYEALAHQLTLLPDHLTIVLQPGNHDAVRPAEPQPTFEKEIQDLFSGKDYVFVGNPCTFSLHGVEILSYHGQSLLDFATNIQHLNYNQPTEVMKVMLKKRHLAPVYGGYTPLAPEQTDYMIIDRVPDIFVTGHVHISNIDNYRGVTLINASSWQAQTTYQKMLNFIPDSAKLPIVNLQTGNATTMDFSQKII